MTSPAPPSPLRLAPGVTYQVTGAMVEVFTLGRTMRLTLPLFRLLLEFAEPRPAATVFAQLNGTVPLAEYEAVLQKLQASGILLAENPIDKNENKRVIPDFRDLFRGDILRDETLIAGIRAQLEGGRAVVIRDAIEPEFAERVHRELEATAAWKPYEHVSPLFHYHHHNLYSDNEFPDSLRECKAIFDRQETRALMSRLSGRDCSGRAIVGASLYLPGDHSLPHRDFGMSRTVAFVWHLTKAWQSSWGGHLYWCPSGTSVAPMFNCLTLFNVLPSSLHLVTSVSQYARGKRMAVNGWWTSTVAVGDEEAPPTSEAPPAISEARYGAPHQPLSPDARILAI
jgi:hypothetical protein